jgi:hypothetical protein
MPPHYLTTTKETGTGTRHIPAWLNRALETKHVEWRTLYQSGTDETLTALVAEELRGMEGWAKSMNADKFAAITTGRGGGGVL